jgi:hypothetical protein
MVRLPKGTAQINLQVGFIAGAVDLLMGPNVFEKLQHSLSRG